MANSHIALAGAPRIATDKQLTARDDDAARDLLSAGEETGACDVEAILDIDVIVNIHNSSQVRRARDIEVVGDVGVRDLPGAGDIEAIVDVDVGGL